MAGADEEEVPAEVVTLTPGAGRLASPDACIELAAGEGQRRAVLVAEGPIRDMADGRGRYTFTARALQEAVTAGRFNGLACFLDHGQSHPTMRDYVGVWDAAALKALPDGRLAAAAELTVHNPDLVRHVFAALAEPDSRRPDIGVSIVCYPQVAADAGTITGFRSIQSADIVFKPAVATARFFQAAVEATPAPPPLPIMPSAIASPHRAAEPRPDNPLRSRQAQTGTVPPSPTPFYQSPGQQPHG